MRRHSIIARLGSTDTSSINILEHNSVQTQIHFVGRNGKLNFGLDQMIDGLSKRGVYPTNIALDLTLIAAMVTAADTRISRTTESQNSWTREIDLYIPVKNLEVWNGATDIIARMLTFLTGDRWRVFFRQNHLDYKKLVAPAGELIPPPFDSVCLFSGGLDSFVGAIDLLECGKKPLFVSHYWDPSTSSQKTCAKILESIYGEIKPRHLRARVGFPKNLVQGSESENTTRGRSFLFFALAALAASGLVTDTPTVYLPENGLISLNIPLDPLRVGAWSTRTTHPFYIKQWEKLTQHLGLKIAWENPYRFQTKGEMLSACKNLELLSQHAHETISCSSIAKARWKGLSPQHCGYCVPCLIRHASIKKALEKDKTPYLLPITIRSLNSTRAEGIDVRSFQMMARRLSQRSELASILVHKSGPLSDYTSDEIKAYAEVFARGIQEVATIVNDIPVQPL